MKSILVLMFAGLGGVWLGFAGIGIASGYAWWIAQDQGALTLIERNGVFGLFSIVILGCGTIGIRVGLQLVAGVNEVWHLLARHKVAIPDPLDG